MNDLLTLLTLSTSTDARVEINSWVLWAFVVLGIITFGCSFITSTWETNWKNIKGKYDDNNMRPMFMFNRQPYILVLYLALSIIVSAVIGAVILFIVGALGYLLLWVVKLLIWAFIIIGWIALVGGVLTLVFSEDKIGFFLSQLERLLCFFKQHYPTGEMPALKPV